MKRHPLRSAQSPRSSRLRLGLLFCAALLPVPAQAFTLEFPLPATPQGERRADLTSYRLPTGPFRQDQVPTELAEGNLDQTAWRLDAPGQTTLQILAPLRDQITAAGWQTVFECETEACGGFDFRYAIDVLPEPEMHVDLGDYRFLAARRDGGDGPEYLSLLVSRSADQGFVQMTLVGTEAAPDLSASTKSPEALDAGAEPAEGKPVAELAASLPDPAATPDDLTAALDAGAPWPLDDLSFSFGVARLKAGDYASLQVLADWLAANPEATIALVGHTDSSGALAANTALSKKRAEAVKAELVTRFGIAEARIRADGVGPLSPRADNATQEGRIKNRRVEVISTPTR